MSDIDSNKITLVTGYTKDNNERLAMSRKVVENQRNYAKKHGYDYQAYEENKAKEGGFGGTVYEPYWSKIVIINDWLKKNIDNTGKEEKWLVWLDDDMVIMDDSIKIQYFIDKYAKNQEKSVIVTRDAVNWHHGSPKTSINTGMLFVKNTPKSKEIFDDIWKRRNTPFGQKGETYGTCKFQACLHEQAAMADFLRDNTGKNENLGIAVIDQRDKKGIGINTFFRGEYYTDNQRSREWEYYSDPPESKAVCGDFTAQATGIPISGFTRETIFNDNPEPLRKNAIDNLIRVTNLYTDQEKKIFRGDISEVNDEEKIKAKKQEIANLDEKIAKNPVDGISTDFTSLSKAKNNLDYRIVELFRESINEINSRETTDNTLEAKNKEIKDLRQKYQEFLFDINSDNICKKMIDRAAGEAITEVTPAKPVEPEATQEATEEAEIQAANDAAVNGFKIKLNDGKYTEILKVLITGGEAKISGTEITSLLAEAKQPKADEAKVAGEVNGIVSAVNAAYKGLVSEVKKEERLRAISTLLLSSEPELTGNREPEYNGALRALLTKEQEFLAEIKRLAKEQADKVYRSNSPKNVDILNLKGLDNLRSELDNDLNALNIPEKIEHINLDKPSREYYKVMYEEKLKSYLLGINYQITRKKAEERHAEKDENLVKKIKAAKDVGELMGETVLGPYINGNETVPENIKAEVSRAIVDKFEEIFKVVSMREFKKTGSNVTIVKNAGLLFNDDFNTLGHKVNHIVANRTRF